MTISLINIGNIANDGTGDDLRQAFAKVNDNFEYLSGLGPESNTASNVGTTGEGIFKEKVGTDLQFKKIVAGSNITLTATNDTITVNSSGGLENLQIQTDAGGVTLQDGDTLTFEGGAFTTTSMDVANNKVIINSQTSLLTDTNPQLATTLNAQNNNIINVNELSANTATASSFVGSLQGLVYNVDVRTLNEPYESIDFGGLTDNLTNWIDFILFTYDVDLGTITSPAELNMDLGTLV